jgi:quinol-cytochrome oxidoreductase complex cytochrome b subunit/mono/diheme cytochrome c family protein
LFKPLSDWLDARTGYKHLMHEALDEPIPGGAKWRYVFGSALTSTFLIQLATGLLLMASYSPSSSTAWGSVFYINEVMSGGWFLRGIHHFGSQAMIVLLALHLLQVLVAGAYRAPREVNWWFGMILLFLTLGLSLTGYLLPWDQKGYWATKVATNIAGGTPVIGPAIQKVILGGPDYGNQTLTRFYALHVGVLPLLLILTLAGHVALFRKHGVTAPKKARGEGKFWPEQVFMDVVAGAGVLGIMILLVMAEHGAVLDAPADPSSSDYPARPEWYFLSLFQMLKKFPGELEILGTIIIPGAIVTTLMLLPLLDKILPGKLAHFLACSLVFGVVGGAGFLTVQAWNDDANDTVYAESRAKADIARRRALTLAGNRDVGIPPDGAAYVLLRDPLTHGRAVLEGKCLGCHVYEGKGTGTQTAADLAGFGSQAWVRGLLEKPQSDAYFGKVPQCNGMAEWKARSKLKPLELDSVARFVADLAKIDPDELSPVEWASNPKVAEDPALALFIKDCGSCHLLGDSGVTEGGLRDAPDLYAWGSPKWTDRMIRRPGAPDLYGYLDKAEQMPAFADELTPNDRMTLVRYLKGTYLHAPGEQPHVPVEKLDKVAAGH